MTHATTSLTLTEQAAALTEQLERDGILVLPDLISAESILEMRQAMDRRLQRLRWNHFDGYEKTEPYRHMVQDVLTLAPGFVDLALHPLIQEILHRYIGPDFQLVEAKAWKSNPTTKDFNGWHGDCWFDQQSVKHVPREVKLALYLTDVKSGAFNFVKGTHGTAPRTRVPDAEVERAMAAGHEIVEVMAPAGTAFLFDTTGFHRQGVPILEPRQAVFYCYHEASVPLQAEDVEYYRYHPLLLNAAFLGGLSVEDFRVLGFGDRRHYQPGFQREPAHETFQSVARHAFHFKLRADAVGQRVWGRLRRTFGLR